MFFQLFLAMLMGLSSPAGSTSTGTTQGSTVSTNDVGPGTGGNGGQLPPPKP